jgi:hypothetical protein
MAGTKVIFCDFCIQLKIDEKLKEKGKYYNNLRVYALDVYAIYPCFKCKKPFIAGMIDCELDMQQNDDQEVENAFRPEDYTCEGCADLPTCKKGGDEHKDHLVWKCKFCCNAAQWFCGGNTHYCEPCHRDAGRITRNKDLWPKCPGKDTCPSGGNHPEPGSTHAIGCMKCWEEAGILPPT